MTPPVYTDKDKVHGLTKKDLEALAERYKDASPKDPEKIWVLGMAKMCLHLWGQRDAARDMAGLQDESIQKATIVLLKLEALRKLAATLSEVMTAGDTCGEPFSQTMRKAWEYVCDRGDNGEVIGQRLEQGWQTLQEIETTTAQVLEALHETKEAT